MNECLVLEENKVNNYLQLNSISQAVEVLKKKEVIAYPTESVFGVGCDPDSQEAVSRLLEIKKRSIEKGLILIAAEFKQLRPYVDDSSLTDIQWKVLFSPFINKPVTFVFPAKASTPCWLTGCFNSIAVRITKHPLIIDLCRKFGKPIVSTSANFTGLPPCRSIQEIRKNFSFTLPVFNGKVGNYRFPSEIRDILTGKRLR